MTVNRITIKQVIKSPLFLCIVMQPILDIIAYIQYNNPIGTMAGYLRLAFVIVVPIFVFIKTSYKKGFLFSLLPIALLGLLHCANSFRVGYISFFEDMGYFIRTWYMPILAISFIFYFNHRKEKEYVKKLLGSVSAKYYSEEDNANSLSGGNQQKIALAKWISADCKCVVFDEPTRGVDVGAKTEIYKIINALAENGIAVIVISSEMQEIIGLCDRAVIMRQGEVTGELTKEEFNENNLIKYAMGI